MKLHLLAGMSAILLLLPAASVEAFGIEGKIQTAVAQEAALSELDTTYVKGRGRGRGHDDHFRDFRFRFRHDIDRHHDDRHKRFRGHFHGDRHRHRHGDHFWHFRTGLCIKKDHLRICLTDDLFRGRHH